MKLTKYIYRYSLTELLIIFLLLYSIIILACIKFLLNYPLIFFIIVAGMTSIILPLFIIYVCEEKDNFNEMLKKLKNKKINKNVHLIGKPNRYT